jgi:hypothetical protein
MTDRMTDEQSPVFARAQRTRPQVAQPSSPWTMVLGTGGVALLGAVAFTTLSNGREAKAQTAPVRMVAQTQLAAAAPAMSPQFQAPLAMQQPLQPMPPAAAQPRSPQEPAETHWRAPAVIVDLS